MARRKAEPTSFILDAEEDQEESGVIEGDLADRIAATCPQPVSASFPGYGEYEINVEQVLREELPDAFSMVPEAPLNPDFIGRIPLGYKGAYILFYDRIPVYAGKTDTRHGFRDRLLRHSKSVQHRVNLDPARMSFRALRIMVFSAFDVEAILISEMRSRNQAYLSWNDSGFGSNDLAKSETTGSQQSLM
jgi:hypothetical protein